MMLKIILPYKCFFFKTSNVKNIMSSKTCLHTLMDIFELLQWNDVEALNLKKCRALHLHC
jgi:hypothetical protein